MGNKKREKRGGGTSNDDEVAIKGRGSRGVESHFALARRGITTDTGVTFLNSVTTTISAS